MSLAYMTACGALYVLAPRFLLAPYAAGSDALAFAEIGRLSAVLLRFVALYSIFDMMNLVFAGGLKGAGDTVYPLLATIVLSWSLMIVPAALGCLVAGGGVNVAWTAATAYIVALGLLMRRRFRRGGWKRLRVIEPRLAELEAAG
jgi:MATE family multidrug resistance protein